MKLMRLVYLLLLGPLLSYGQSTSFGGQPRQWLFGHGAGLDFSAGAPQPLTGSAMNTVEGSAVATDDAGQLLFYTDGARVWNRQHKRMPNGGGLAGSPNSTQSALVLRQPGSDSLWYVFTTDFQGGNQGLRYSVVSLARRRGMGDVTLKNELLFAPVSEQLTAVRHANGRDTWVIAHRWSSPQYLSYLVTAEGIQSPPVQSTAGAMRAGPGRASIGWLRASPDGRHLAAAHWRDASKFEVLDFDPQSGQIDGRVGLEPYPDAYGVAFSADGSKLYGTARDTTKGAEGAVIWQFNLRPGAGSSATGAYNRVVGRSRSKKLGALQLGPDGRLYVARDGAKFLGVIAAPDAAGDACGYQDDGLPLGDGRCRLGLPNNW